MSQPFVIRRKADGRFYFNGPKVTTHQQRQMSEAALDALRWTDNLQRARTYMNRGSAKTCLPYRADEADYEFVTVRLEIVT